MLARARGAAAVTLPLSTYSVTLDREVRVGGSRRVCSKDRAARTLTEGHGRKRGGTERVYTGGGAESRFRGFETREVWLRCWMGEHARPPL